MERTKSALGDHIYECALQAIENENYDIIDEGFLASDLAEAVRSIFKALMKKGRTGGWVFKTEPISIYALGLSWKISNSRPCFVSCSDDNATGVSRSEACIFGRLYGCDEDDAKELLDMMNEAWYLMKNA